MSDPTAGERACGLCRRYGHDDDDCPSSPSNWPRIGPVNAEAARPTLTGRTPATPDAGDASEPLSEGVEATRALMAHCQCGHLVMHGWHLKGGCQFDDCPCPRGAGAALLASDWLASREAAAYQEGWGVGFGQAARTAEREMVEREAAAATRARAEALREVWHVSAHGRSVDRVCDSLATGKSVCDDLMNQLGGPWIVVEDWANLNVPEAPERWVRYVQRGDSDPVEQAVAAIRIDTSGTWFRENTPDYRADSLAPDTAGDSDV